MSGVRPSHQTITPTNHGAYVTIVIACLACISGISALLRVYVSTRRKLTIEVNDVLFFLALGAAIVQTVLVEEARTYGLGRHIDALSSSDVDKFYKYLYAARLVGLSLSTTLSKSSVVMLYRRIFVQGPYKEIAYQSMMGMVLVWGLFSFFALAFECDLPQPWNFTTSHCPAQEGLVLAVIVLNIVTDLVLVVFVCVRLYSVNTTKFEYLTVSGLFSSRLLVCAASIAQAVVFVPERKMPDQTWSLVTYVILESVVVHLSVITTALPRIYSYVASLQAGLLKPYVTETAQLSTIPSQTPGSATSRPDSNKSNS